MTVIYFVPSLGLFDILNHWRAEQIQFAVSQKKYSWGDLKERYLNASNGDLLYLHNTEPLPWSMFDRWNYSDPNDPEPPDYDLYTGLKLSAYFQIFILLCFLNTVVIFITKYALVNEFRRINIIKQFAHSVENCSIVTPYKDWDFDHGCVEDHKKRFKLVNKEVVVTMIVNFLFNCSMLVPLIFTGHLKNK